MQGVNGNLTVDTVQMSPIGDTPATLDECIVYSGCNAKGSTLTFTL